MRLFLALLILFCAIPSCVALDVLGTSCHVDVQYPEFAAFWSDSKKLDWGAKPELRPPGCSIHVFLRNNDPQPVEMQDVTLEGISLREAVVLSQERKLRKLIFPASIYYSKLPKAQRDALIAAGEPVWWRVEPNPLDSVSEIVIRLRRAPIGKTLSVGVGTLKVLVPVKADQPRIESISFGPNLDEVYLYLHGGKPSKVLLDGTEIASSIVDDPKLDISLAVSKLDKPLAKASFHVFQGA